MPEREVALKELLPLIQAQLESGKKVTFSPRGVSMLPMLRQGKDKVTLSPVKGPLKKYDLPLYRLDNGKFILHRIVEAGETYTCRGDNTYRLERGIRQDQLIAVVSSFTRGNRTISVDDPVYMLYCRVWNKTYPLRNFVRRGIGWIKRRILRVIRKV